jgi:hypothetical protein
VRPAVEGLADQEQRARPGLRLPAGPGALRVAEALGDAQHRHQRTAEGQRAFEVADADEHVREHVGRSGQSAAAREGGIA